MQVLERPAVTYLPPSTQGDNDETGRARRRGEPSVVQGRARQLLRNLPLLLSLVMGAVSHGYHLFTYPLYITDEGIYMQQAWAVLREARLSPYTYFYDHAPAGWLAIAAWVSFLPSQFETFGNAINTGRALMLVVHLASVFLLFRVTCFLSGRRSAAFIAAFLFNMSPLAIFYQRQVLLDNLMVFWVLLSLYLASTGSVLTAEARASTDCACSESKSPVLRAIMSGFALAMAILSKENAIFFAPVIAYLLCVQLRGAINFRFAFGFWSFTVVTVSSLYLLYATLKNELFPTAFNFDLHNPPADHVSLLYTIWWQLHRSQGSILDPNSLVWQFSLGAWLPKDRFLLMAGGLAAVVNLYLGLRNRRSRRGYLVASLLALSYTFYLARGSLMLEFYVVPLLPFFAMNVGMLGTWLLGLLPERSRATALLRATALAAFVGVLLAHPSLGYVLVVDEFGKVVPHDLYKLPLTEMQTQQLQFVRQHVPPQAKIVIDDDIWVDLHDTRPFYKWAHSHYKAAADPDVRDKLFAKDWRNIDYFVMSNKMQITMQQNNGDHSEDWLLQGLDHAKPIWSLERGDIQLAVLQVQK